MQKVRENLIGKVIGKELQFFKTFYLLPYGKDRCFLMDGNAVQWMRGGGVCVCMRMHTEYCTQLQETCGLSDENNRCDPASPTHAY